MHLSISGNVMTWVPFICLPWVLRQFADCQSTGLATIDRKWYFLFAFFILISLALEWLAFRHVFPCVLRVYTPTVLGCTFSAGVYMVVQFGISAVAHADVMTNSIFLARVLRTHDCDPHLFAWGPWPWLALWVSMLIQVLYVVLSVFPRSSRVWGHDIKRYYPSFDLKRWGENMNVVYRTYLEPMQTHQNAIFVLADGARWATIKNFDNGYLSAFHAPRQQGSSAFKALRATMRRSCVFLCLETAPFLIAQWCVFWDATLQQATLQQALE